jgi:hypothetical protein
LSESGQHIFAFFEILIDGKFIGRGWFRCPDNKIFVSDNVGLGLFRYARFVIIPGSGLINLSNWN